MKSEDREAVDDEEAMEEREPLRDTIEQVKVEALESVTNSPPFNHDDVLSPADAPIDEIAGALVPEDGGRTVPSTIK